MRRLERPLLVAIRPQEKATPTLSMTPGKLIVKKAMTRRASNLSSLDLIDLGTSLPL
jgi:hypothetical protein